MQTQLAELYQQFASCSCTLEIAQPASKQGSFDFHKVVLSFGFFLCRPLAWSWLARSYSNEQNLAEIERIFRPQIFPQRSGGINPWKQSLSPPPLRYWSQGFFLGESFFLFVFLAAFQSDWNHAKGERERGKYSNYVNWIDRKERECFFSIPQENPTDFNGFELHLFCKSPLLERVCECVCALDTHMW